MKMRGARTKAEMRAGKAAMNRVSGAFNLRSALEAVRPKIEEAIKNQRDAFRAGMNFNEGADVAKRKMKKKGPGTVSIPSIPRTMTLLPPKRAEAIEVPKPKLEGRAPRPLDDEEV